MHHVKQQGYLKTKNPNQSVPVSFNDYLQDHINGTLIAVSDKQYKSKMPNSEPHTFSYLR